MGGKGGGGPWGVSKFNARRHPDIYFVSSSSSAALNLHVGSVPGEVDDIEGWLNMQQASRSLECQPLSATLHTRLINFIPFVQIILSVWKVTHLKPFSIFPCLCLSTNIWRKDFVKLQIRQKLILGQSFPTKITFSDFRRGRHSPDFWGWRKWNGVRSHSQYSLVRQANDQLHPQLHSAINI